MAYPDVSDWTAGTPGSAWYVENIPGLPVRVCRTDGWSFMTDLRSTVKNALGTESWPSIGGQQVHGDEIALPEQEAIPGFDEPLLRGIYALAVYASVPSAFRQAITSDYSRRQIGTQTLQTALWLLKPSNAPADLKLPSRVVFPVWGQSPQRPQGNVTTSSLECTVAPSALDLVRGAPLGLDSSTWYKNPWVIGGSAAAVLVLMLAATRGRA